MSFAIAPRQRCKPGASHGDFRDYGPQPLGTVARSRRHGRGQTGWARIPAAPRGGPALAPGAQPWAKQRRYPIPQSAADTPRLAPCIVAIPLGRFFHAPQLPLVVVAMSTTFVITSFKTVPLALLQRDLRFKTLAFIDLSQALVLAISMVGFAVAGFRYWTLVCGGVLSALISTGAILRLRRAPLAWPRRTSLKPAITLSSNVLISRLCWYTSSNADFLVAGRILGKAALGFYNVGWTLASVPVDKVTALVGQVTPAFLSAVQTDHAALRRYLLRITEGIALITFPLGLGLALVAQDFVLVILGSKWSATIAPLRLLAAYATIRSITPLLAQVLHTIRDTRFEMWNMVAAAVG